MDDTDRDDTILAKATIIVPTPWVSQLHDIYAKYQDKVIAELDMCYDFMQSQGLHPQSIGITGTDGKSTVTRLIAETLRQLLPSHHVHITWNFDDAMSKTILDILKAWTQSEKHIFVTECSSFMLYPIKRYHFDIGIRTNFAPDHLNWHPNMPEYFNAKQQLFVHSDICYTTSEVFEQLTPTVKEKTHIYTQTYDLSATNFVWKHNEKNCALTLDVVKQFCASFWAEQSDTSRHSEQSEESREWISDKSIYKAISTIKPLKHRMQPIKEFNGVTWYDDGKSTSAQSLGAALSSFDKPIVVICWGSDKWDNFDHLAPLFKHNTVQGIFLWQTSPQFASLFDTIWIPYTLTSSMTECVEQARHAAQLHNVDTILFSPGCASFDLFKNYEDRAQQYIAAIENLQ